MHVLQSQGGMVGRDRRLNSSPINPSAIGNRNRAPYNFLSPLPEIKMKKFASNDPKTRFWKITTLVEKKRYEIIGTIVSNASSPLVIVFGYSDKSPPAQIARAQVPVKLPIHDPAIFPILQSWWGTKNRGEWEKDRSLLIHYWFI